MKINFKSTLDYIDMGSTIKKCYKEEGDLGRSGSLQNTSL